ncbi:MAG: serine/threonine protein kinase, partial [Polyangiaceae bacterium]|nr:serine/threonine protein kinase [Polyangiaceae bacterium]
MRPGEIVVGRFEVERQVAEGGMGTVHRARDLLCGGAVALKILRGEGGAAAARMLREAELLLSLEDPGIVRHIAHGVVGAGGAERVYLAMEWLEGEDLEQRLRRARLSPAESVALARRVAAALDAAHRRGVVHRDIKPSNLFLVGGDVGRVKILDFGVARQTRVLFATTGAGALLGTPGYMAPEQARGEPDVDARADVFSLGCVLYECLAGRPPFLGEHVMAVLAKILLEDPPRLRELCPGAPRALEALVARMLAKDPALRPSDARAAAEALEALDGAGEPGGAAPGGSIAPPSVGAGLGAGELRLVPVVLVGPPRAPAAAAAGTVDRDAETWAAAPTSPAVPQTPVASGPLHEAAAAHGGRLEPLLDGAVVITFPGRIAAGDAVARAAACALALRDAA